MSAAFTPGPWGHSFVKMDTGFEGDTFMAGPLDEEGGFSSIIEGGLVLADDNENQANAHLIAAAPDMFEALAALVAATNDPDLLGFSAAAREAEKVLAKARGEA